jgi:hypothetical protein
MEPNACKPSRTVGARELLASTAVDLVVEDGREVSILDREYQHYLYNVRIESFSDLQLLGFVPRGIAEDAMRKAIQSDDERALAIAEQRYAQSSGCGCCSCNGHSQDAHAMASTHVRPASLQTHLQMARRETQTQLTALLSEHLRTKLDPGGPYVRWTQTFVEAFDRRMLRDFIALLFQDIYIGAKSTLKLPATKKSLYARNIVIHQTGRLEAGAAYTKIWANSIAPPGAFELTKFVPWHIASA